MFYFILFYIIVKAEDNISKYIPILNQDDELYDIIACITNSLNSLNTIIGNNKNSIYVASCTTGVIGILVSILKIYKYIKKYFEKRNEKVLNIEEYSIINRTLTITKDSITYSQTEYNKLGQKLSDFIDVNDLKNNLIGYKKFNSLTY